MKSKLFKNKTSLIETIKNSNTYAEVLRKSNLKCCGGNYITLKNFVNTFNIDTNHFLGQRHLKGKKRETIPLISTKDLLTKGIIRNSGGLKKRLIKEKLLKNSCYECGINDWLGRPLSLHIDHINGDKSDNRIENLRILCPNCHSQTPTYCGKNNNKINKKCEICKVKIYKTSTLCIKCNNLQKRKDKINWPSILNLLDMVSKTSYSAVGRKFGVSGNAVKKRINKHKA